MGSNKGIGYHHFTVDINCLLKTTETSNALLFLAPFVCVQNWYKLRKKCSRTKLLVL